MKILKDLPKYMIYNNRLSNEFLSNRILKILRHAIILESHGMTMITHLKKEILFSSTTMVILISRIQLMPITSES